MAKAKIPVKTKKKPVILTVSSANVDLTANMPYIPSAGQTLKSNYGYSITPGGKGANTAFAVNKLGGESFLCSKLGNDDYADKLMKMYPLAGINTSYITKDPEERTGLALVMVEKDGTNRIVTYPGANRKLSYDDTAYAMECCPDALILQFEIEQSTIIDTAKDVRRAGVPIIVDAGPALKDFPLSALGPVDIFSPNETELYAYTGINPTSSDECLRACYQLSKLIKAEYYIIKLGERGVFYYDGKYHDVISSHKVKAVDSTSAGDVFTAALAVEYLRSGNIKRACEYANIAGAITVTRAGSFNSVPSHDDIKLFAVQRDLKINFN
ncbi:MAG: ribokinase [Clostridia bacterium]|nr:ribokinase [Clostridia bacterium]